MYAPSLASDQRLHRCMPFQGWSGRSNAHLFPSLYHFLISPIVLLTKIYQVTFNEIKKDMEHGPDPSCPEQSPLAEDLYTKIPTLSYWLTSSQGRKVFS